MTPTIHRCDVLSQRSRAGHRLSVRIAVSMASRAAVMERALTPARGVFLQGLDVADAVSLSSGLG